MTSSEAAKLLELPDHATPDQIEARFLELRTKLEDKIAKAPTPGLKAKYRETLDQVTVAFETLVLAADSSALPVLQKQSADGRRQRTDVGGQTSENVGSPLAGGPSAARPQGPALQGSPAPRRKSGGKEFFLVAIIALAVLGAGGWFIMKTRAESAEKARLAAEARAQAEAKAAEEKRLAEEARLAAEAERKAAEEEKARLAAAEKAERERQDRLLASIRVRLAESNLAWEVLEREEREAERQLGELKTELRDLRDTSSGRVEELRARLEAAQGYADWLRDYIVRHPARRLRVRTEELISSRLADEAAAEMDNLQAALETARVELPKRQADTEASLYGTARLTFANRIDRWSFLDAFGREHGGDYQEVAELSRVARGTATVTLWRGDAAVKFTLAVPSRRTAESQLRYPESSITITANVPGAEVFGPDGRIGQAPLTLADQWPGSREFEVRATGYHSRRVQGVVVAGKTLALNATLEEALPTESEILADFTQRAAGNWVWDGAGMGIGYLKIVPGSNRLESMGKALFVTVRAAGTLSVLDRRQRTIRYVADQAPANVGEMTIRLEGDKVVFQALGKEYAYERTDKNPF